MNLKKNRWMNLVYGLVLIIVGILTLVFAITNMGAIDNILSYSVAGALFVVGLMHIITAFVTNSSEFFSSALFLGSVAIAAGAVFCIDTGLISNFVIYFIATFFLAFGAVCIAKAIFFIVNKSKVNWIVFFFIIATIMIAAGVLILVFSNQSKVFLYCAVGGSLLISGVFEFIMGIKELSSKKDKDANEEE